MLLLVRQCKVRLFALPWFCVFIIQFKNLTLGITGRNSGKSKAGPSLGKKKVHKRVFCQEMFSSMPCFFLHHQIDLAQRDGKKILLSMITEVSRLLCLDFDFPENYTNINQVFMFQEHIAVLSLLNSKLSYKHFFNSATFSL